MSLLTSRCCFALPAAVAASRNHTSLQLLLHAMALGAGRPSASSLHDSDPHTVSKAVCPRPPTHPLTHPRRNQMASYLGVTSSSSRQPSSSYWQHKTSWPCAAESAGLGQPTQFVDRSRRETCAVAGNCAQATQAGYPIEDSSAAGLGEALGAAGRAISSRRTRTSAGWGLAPRAWEE
jgi:hypothetical protein